MEAVKKKQLEAQLEAADKLFAAGDLRRARMHVDMAVAMDRSGACPEAQRARAAYRVLAADKADHYGVLGVAAPPGGRPTKESHDAVKAQHKALCDMFDPGKAGGTSAAAAGAFKLVNQAFAALTDIRKNEGAVPGRAPAPRHRMPPLLPVPRPNSQGQGGRRARAGGRGGQAAGRGRLPCCCCLRGRAGGAGAEGARRGGR